MIKIAVIANYPIFSALPSKYFSERILKATQRQHPAPWVHALCQELSLKPDIDVHIISHSRYTKRIIHNRKNGIKYTFIPKYEPRSIDPYHLYLPALTQFAPTIKKYQPDIVHGFGTEGFSGLVAAVQKKPSIVFIQGIVEKLAPYSDKPKRKLFVLRLIERYIIKNANGLIAENNFALKWAQTITRKTAIKIIPHAITRHYFASKPTFKNKIIVCIGTVSLIKGSDTVLEAFYSGIKRNPNIFKSSKLIYIGGGPLKNELVSRTQEYGISENVQFKGRMIHDQILKEFENACLLAIGSRMDTSPNVITEAHSAGIPVVGTNSGGIPEMIQHENDGYIVPVDDIVAMSRRMEILLSNIELCAAMGRSGREKVRKINDPSRIADEHISFYKEILRMDCQ